MNQIQYTLDLSSGLPPRRVLYDSYGAWNEKQAIKSESFVGSFGHSSHSSSIFSRRKLKNIESATYSGPVGNSDGNTVGFSPWWVVASPLSSFGSDVNENENEPPAPKFEKLKCGARVP